MVGAPARPDASFFLKGFIFRATPVLAKPVPSRGAKLHEDGSSLRFLGLVRAADQKWRSARSEGWALRWPSHRGPPRSRSNPGSTSPLLNVPLVAVSLCRIVPFEAECRPAVWDGPSSLSLRKPKPELRPPRPSGRRSTPQNRTRKIVRAVPGRGKRPQAEDLDHGNPPTNL